MFENHHRTLIETFFFSAKKIIMPCILLRKVATSSWDCRISNEEIDAILITSNKAIQDTNTSNLITADSEEYSIDCSDGPDDENMQQLKQIETLIQHQDSILHKNIQYMSIAATIGKKIPSYSWQQSGEASSDDSSDEESDNTSSKKPKY